MAFDNMSQILSFFLLLFEIPESIIVKYHKIYFILIAFDAVNNNNHEFLGTPSSTCSGKLVNHAFCPHNESPRTPNPRTSFIARRAFKKYTYKMEMNPLTHANNLFRSGLHFNLDVSDD